MLYIIYITQFTVYFQHILMAVTTTEAVIGMVEDNKTTPAAVKKVSYKTNLSLNKMCKYM